MTNGRVEEMLASAIAYAGQHEYRIRYDGDNGVWRLVYFTKSEQGFMESHIIPFTDYWAEQAVEDGRVDELAKHLAALYS